MEKHQKTWIYNEEAALAELENAERAMELDGNAYGSSNLGVARLGPESNYTAPFMNVVQPLEVLTEAATFTSQGRVRGGKGGQRAGRNRRRRRGQKLVPVPVIMGVNADEGLMFVHGAFPVTMHKVRVWLGARVGLRRRSPRPPVTLAGRFRVRLVLRVFAVACTGFSPC